MSKFNYLIEKINQSEFTQTPFKHVYIEDFFEDHDFRQLISTNEIATPTVNSDAELIDSLYERGFRAIPFPGCIDDRDKYIRWHSEGKKVDHHSACEGFGMTLRLMEPKSPILAEISEFLASEAFNTAVAEKFGIDYSECTIDGGIQKYLDGYEISPHPDIRRKAATFMVNINPSPESETSDHHTHYLTFRPEREYVKSFWKGNPSVDRAWVPWSWTTSVYQQTKNNSIVLFSPSDDTMHGVKADYDHLVTQRTQLYGNLWHKVNQCDKKLEWEDLDLLARTEAKSGIKSLVKTLVPDSTIQKLRERREKARRAKRGIGDRTY